APTKLERVWHRLLQGCHAYGVLPNAVPEAGAPPTTGNREPGTSKPFPPMIPREILKKIRQIEIRTNRLVSESLSGQYHSVFKGQGMNFDEVREYQPGDEVRFIDWNVTARMNHPFVKKFIEERELTVMLLVDLSGSGLFGSGEQSKRELAAEIGSVLAFSAIRNNDKVGLILFTDRVELFIPPRKGRRHVLRVIREILFFEPQHHGTNLNVALDFLSRVTSHRSIAVILSDFLDSNATRSAGAGSGSNSPTLLPATLPALRQAHRKHDVVAVQIADRYEFELPAVGRLVLQDAETGEVVEIDTRNPRSRNTFAERQVAMQTEVEKTFRSLGIDTILLRTDQPYGIALARFFETREKRRRHG
ncbi:MAG TPA: DUF58 domain-containing protein, partial [Roseimicrobium sp.]|nr:DUF58 domain-containing protein [Roseimicrobium sp.]